MTLKTTIAAKVKSSGFEPASRVLEAHLFQYLESEIRSAMEREMIREIVASAPPCERASSGNEVCTLEIKATIPIQLTNPLHQI